MSTNAPHQNPTTIEELRAALQQFAAERDWDQFHCPKNLAIALSVEAAELLEHFQWITESESRFLNQDKQSKVREEVADVFLYLVRLADKLGIDLMSAAAEKILLNGLRYPTDKVRGSNKKYTEY
jgi:NTP pyrophosphatase (non-canonical NTP hydrolase)